MITIFSLRARAAAGAVALLAAAWAAPAAAVTGTIGFINIPSGTETWVDPYVSSFSVDVSDAGAGFVKFLFKNDLAAVSSFIGDVYIDDRAGLGGVGLLLGAPAPVVNFDNVGTVGFDTHNGAFPQGNNAAPSFTEDFKYKFEGGSNGVHNGEALGIKFGYSGTLEALLLAISLDEIRFGMHIQGLPDGKSDSIVSLGSSFSVEVIPAPAGVLLLVSAFGVAAGARALRRA